ncbi:hypothetical protein [Archangium lipolyticum]|uniref:hypothetical protein n=1 Tax=Archangium lipolyticum TaxID=2970465 RepID=UPI00214A858E|nr:hypothetical protein [Archangium lipolyticum]
MRVQRMVLPLSLALMGLSGCNVYDRWSGKEFNAGPIDVTNFPADYLGVDGNRQIAGLGTFQAKLASAGEQRVEYFLFQLPTTQRSASGLAGALTLRTGAKAGIATPSAYVFDSCKAPAGYTFDLERDGINMGEQGVVFTRLPTATYALGATPTYSYVPIVSKVQVTSNGVDCQKLKSEEAVVASREVTVPLTAPVNGKMVGIPDSTYHAYAIIDPGAAVYHAEDLITEDEEPLPLTGIGVQKWGWYNQYLLAYIDGGQVPTRSTTDDKGVETVSIATQKLYYPVSKTVGSGFDVLEAARGQPGYSPVCKVYTYDPGAATTLPTSTAEIERDYAGTIKAVTGAGTYVYCLQAENQAE